MMIARRRLLVVAFVGLSFLDLFLTWRLMEAPHGAVYEANPLAAAVLVRFGWLGLGLFKLACVGVALGSIFLLSRWRPALGSRLLAFTCPGLLILVSYSLFLLATGAPGNKALPVLDTEVRRAERLEGEFQKTQVCARVINRLGHDLAHGRRELAGALTALIADLARIQHNPAPWLYRQCAIEDDQACLAACLIRQAGLVQQENPKLGVSCLPRLAQQFQELCRCPLPAFATETHLVVTPVLTRANREALAEF
jgi:hypothetical protein